MTPTHIHDSETTYAKRTGNDGKPIRTVGILANMDDNGQPAICDRWARPFLERDMDVIYIPAGAKNIDDLLEKIDGLLLPGGDANIHPFFYDPLYQQEGDTDLRDIARDRTAIELISKAYYNDIPTLGICRGMQEMVVTFGGQIEKLDLSEINHAAGYNVPKDENGKRCQKAMDQPVHLFNIQSGGKFENWYPQTSFMVNSIHYEGITQKHWDAARHKRLRGLFAIEAMAPDGVVEAISAKDRSFFVGVQPHFELEGDLHQVLFDAFCSEIGVHAQSNAPNISAAMVEAPEA